jgi:hypothetical protein
MCSRKQCWSLDHKQRYRNFLQILFYFALSSPNQEDCTTVDERGLVFLQLSQETLAFVLKVPKTQYQPLAKPCFHITSCQALIFSSCPHHLFLVFWELMLGYVTPMYWYLIFLIVKFYPKRPSVLTPHSSYCDLNVKTLASKCSRSKMRHIIPQKHAN